MELKKQSWIILLMLSVAKGEVLNNTQNTSSYLIPCEQGWFLYGDKCYKAFDISNSVTWREAEVNCAKHNGSLVTIQSQELQDFLKLFLLLDVKSDLWIGLNDIQRKWNYAWADGSIVNYTFWDKKEPSDITYGSEKCVEMSYDSLWEKGKWRDNRCYSTLPFMCQKNKSEQSMSHDPRFCTGENEGAWKHQNSCYHTVLEEMSWDDAEKHCQTVFKGHLLAITDADIDLFLRHVVLSDFNKNIWIGIKIQNTDQQMWSSAWVLRFNKWEPNHTLNVGNCAYMTKTGIWSTVPCFRKWPFVCEVPEVKPPTLKPAPEGWGCPELSKEWIDLGGDTCYIFETLVEKYWHEANFICLKKGGHLASINSVAESNAIHRRIKGLSHKGRMLIGLRTSLTNNSVFEWVDGTKLHYQNWKYGKPRNIFRVCGEISIDDMKWNYITCDIFKRIYICSAKKVPLFLQGSNESTSIASQLPMETNSSVPPLRNESTPIDSQIPEETNCSVVAVLLVAVIILFVVGCTIDIYKNHCGKYKDQRWKYFAMSFSARRKTESKELTLDDSVYSI